ncbi:hypothetical protein G6011_11669 [Alternaria panax]|uniref:Uncharacterized protein n=1 Tax=Alternaria panax TaxID=48097 RepID=A0AAD4IE49_9PLEO|nr:hypothetical protein G6011_11669 [Alternaria panax]
MPASLRNLSPFKGKPLWEPDDEEWEDLNATHISSTYKASFKDPAQYVPRKTTNASALSRFSSTITSFLPPCPTKLAAEARLREEEELRDKLEELHNTYYSDPDGDLHDTIMASVHIPTSRYFQLDRAGCFAAPRVPHVIDLERYFNTQDALVGAAYPRLSDAVATILSHTDRECVEAFLDPRIKEFVYRREVDGSVAGNTLVVRRVGNGVIAGSYRNLGFSLSWTLYVKALFSATGLWYETYASPVAGTSPIVNGVPMWDIFLPVNTAFPFPASSLALPPSSLPAFEAPESSLPLEISPRKIVLATPHSPTKEAQQAERDSEEENNTISPTDERFMLYQSRALARYLLRDIWIRFEGRYECKATWEADGVVKSVRLKKALVGFAGEDDDDEMF